MATDITNSNILQLYKQVIHKHQPMSENIGKFSGLYPVPSSHASNISLAASMDGVGTKVIITKLADRFYGRDGNVNYFQEIAKDLVNHCVNDLLAVGAKPLFFMDYIAVNDLSQENIVDIVEGIAIASKNHGMMLLGGETAYMPDIYQHDTFDLVGNIVGNLESGSQITGEQIQSGDVILGLPSNGLHTNGYSLARKVLGIKNNLDDYESCERVLSEQPWGAKEPKLVDVLLKPHKSYWYEISPHFEKIAGIAHITGGGLTDNIKRILPKTVDAVVNPDFWQSTWDIPHIFSLIQERGDISLEQMYKTFNMGVGIVLILKPRYVNYLLHQIPSSAIIGEIVDARKDTCGQCHIVGVSA